jgi:hypothetical protein
MNKSIIFILIFLQFLFLSCSNRKISEKKNNETASTEKEADISEQQKIEFEFYFIEGLKQK